MAFAPRDFNTIVAEMTSQVVATNPGLTDFTTGSVIRSFIETVAKQIQRLETNTFEGILDGVSVGTYQNFNFTRLPATFASGLITFNATPQTSPQTIPANTVVQVPNTNLTYTSNQNTILPANATSVQVLCTSNVLGSAGNTPENTITQLVSAVPNITSITNNAPIINGDDQESDAARISRFQNYILSLSRGTIIALESAAQNVNLTDANGNILEKVSQALVVEPFLTDSGKPIGQIQIYVDNGSGTASSTLVNQVSNVIFGYVDSNGFEHPGYLAAGVEAKVIAVTPFTVNVTCTLTLQPGANAGTVSTNAQTAMTTYIQSLTISQPVLIAQLTSAAINTVGVTNISFSTPSGDTAVPLGQKAVAGTFTIATQ